MSTVAKAMIKEDPEKKPYMPLISNCMCLSHTCTSYPGG